MKEKDDQRASGISLEKQIPIKWQKRRSVKPGLVCSWLINGTHGLSFKKWMRSDQKVIEKK